MKKAKYLFLGLTLVLTMIQCKEQISMAHENTTASERTDELKAPEQQPYYLYVSNLIEALDFIGTPISMADKIKIKEFLTLNDKVNEIQAILQKYTLFNVHINPESRVKVNQGMAKPQLSQGGWKTFLVQVENQAGITAPLTVTSEQAKPVYKVDNTSGANEKITEVKIKDRWLDLSLFTKNPMKETLSGLEVEYFIVQLYSKDQGKRAAKITFSCGRGTQDIGFRSEIDILFQCLPTQKIVFEILDENQKPTTASLIIKDKQGHIYPSQTKRLAPDFYFQPQVYRNHLESINLPKGKYTITYGRGPEYIYKTEDFNVNEKPEQFFKLNLERWIAPANKKWYSGDHHIHAAGCSHYSSPTDGVDPKHMFKHLLGEGVNIGSVLTWGPGYYHQRQFFEGKEHQLSTEENILRYDMEISGFPSGHAGHVVLLRLKDQFYPGTKVIEDWPTYTLPVLRWAKKQGAVTGYAHTGLGLEVVTNKVPNYEMPKFDGIGANEYIVAATHGLVDFISTMDTPPSWELNIWYHMLNNNFRTRISGETDFPCMSDTKVAHGRSYVKLEGELNFDSWVEGLKQGKSYCSEGNSHLFDFKVNDVVLGENGSELKLKSPSKITATVQVSALLDKEKNLKVKPLDTRGEYWLLRPYWNLERSRIGNSRTIPVELIVNGEVVDKKIITADGDLTNISFNTAIMQSSWVAIRIPNSAHTNPIFVMVNNKPIRANKKSAEWCLKAVDVCWDSKKDLMNDKERILAQKDYAHAKKVYQQILNDYK
ncbi:CehA/McbA family metallohydrolase [Aurantibacter crassamenti]|uniref:CehA/McbA family metallohydrolase n=1 Tax=Aurantibacter crassamenti TaxID=1837375 RepID=UPI001939D02D|nr:CehA/McbA family metallohydrolase [Aurantibacter crassamenti]MBM1105905.1 CehA/McbA family metallohydrolase [Aurantibacter crassamenti]